MSQARAQGALAAVGLPGLLCAILTAGLLLWSWRYASHSFDFTDESFYLIWMSAPFRYDWSVSQFGFIYHPLYQVLDGDIASLRRANLLFVFVLAWAVSDRYLRLLGAQQSELGWPRALLAAALATSALMVFSAGLITPNYNTLTLQGLLIALLGLMGLQLPATPRSLPPWLLLGGGGWLVFLAKPSSALALAVLALGYLLMWGRRDVRAAGLSALTAALLLLASALVIDGSLSGFVARLRTGVDIASLILDQDALTHIFRFDFPARSAFDQRLCLSLIAVTALAVMSVWAQGRARKILLLATLLALLDCAWWLWHLPRLSWASLRHFAGFFCMLGVAFGALLGGLLTQRQALLRSTTRVHLATGLLCAALPYVYAFGTYSNYSQAATKASFFWMLAGLTCLHPVANQVRQWRVLVPVAVMAALVSAVFITRAMALPYRQAQALWRNDHQVAIGGPASRLVVSEAVAAYVGAASDAARQAAFADDTPVIDLSGHSPGLVYALKGTALGVPWLLGGYPGSLQHAQAVFARCSCESLAKAWVLVEPDGPRMISADALSSFGAVWARDYLEAARWSIAPGVGGEKNARTQVLYKPVASAELTARCKALRSAPTP